MTWDASWDTVFTRQEWGRYPPEYAIRFIARHYYAAPDRAAVRILDLGCGPGAVTWYLAREGFAASGIDGSAVALGIARRRLADEGLRADLLQADYNHLPWPGGTFDAAIDNVSLCCNPYDACRRIVAEVHRVLKPGGRFLSANFTDRSWGAGLGVEVEPHGYTRAERGPLAGKGFCLFMGRAQVERLYAPFPSVQIDTCSYTVGGGAARIDLWIVEAAAR